MIGGRRVALNFIPAGTYIREHRRGGSFAISSTPLKEIDRDEEEEEDEEEQREYEEAPKAKIFAVEFSNNTFHFATNFPVENPIEGIDIAVELFRQLLTEYKRLSR